MKGDAELIGIIFVFAFSIIVIFSAGAYLSLDSFRGSLDQIQEASLNKYESYAKSAAILQNKTLMEEIQISTYDSSEDRIESINESISKNLGNSYRFEIDNHMTEEVDTVLNSGSGSFSYSKIYIASPKTSKYLIKTGVKE